MTHIKTFAIIYNIKCIIIITNNLKLTHMKQKIKENKKELTINDLALMIGDLSSTVNNLSSRIDDLSSTVNNSSSRIDDLSSTVNNLSLRINDLSSTVDDLAVLTKDGFDRLEKRMDNLEKRMDNLEKRIDNLEKRMDNLEKRMGGLEDRVNKLEDIANYSSSELGILQEEFQKLAVKIEYETLNGNRDTNLLCVENETLKQRITILENKVSILEKQAT